MTPKSQCSKRLGRSIRDAPVLSVAMAYCLLYIDLQGTLPGTLGCHLHLWGYVLHCQPESSFPTPLRGKFCSNKYFHPASAAPLIFTRAHPLMRVVSAFCNHNVYPSELHLSLLIKVVSSVCVLIWVIPGAWTWEGRVSFCFTWMFPLMAFFSLLF